VATAIFTRSAAVLLCRWIHRRRDKHRGLIAWGARSKERRQQTAALNDPRTTRGVVDVTVSGRGTTRCDARSLDPRNRRKNKTRQQRQSHQENEIQEERNAWGSRGRHHGDGVLDYSHVTTGDRSRDSVGYGNGIWRSRANEASETWRRKVIRSHTNVCGDKRTNATDNNGRVLHTENSTHEDNNNGDCISDNNSNNSDNSDNYHSGYHNDDDYNQIARTKAVDHNDVRTNFTSRRKDFIYDQVQQQDDLAPELLLQGRRLQQLLRDASV